MTTINASAATKATGYFNASQNGVPLFNSEWIEVWNAGGFLIIEGSKNLGFPDGSAFRLTINPSTQSGQQEFVPRGDLNEVYYLQPEGGTVYANSGTFNANLDNIAKKYQISFKLNFAVLGVIDGVIDVAE